VARAARVEDHPASVGGGGNLKGCKTIWGIKGNVLEGCRTLRILGTLGGQGDIGGYSN
jgi:hypothetical protein